MHSSSSVFTVMISPEKQCVCVCVLAACFSFTLGSLSPNPIYTYLFLICIFPDVSMPTILIFSCWSRLSIFRLYMNKNKFTALTLNFFSNNKHGYWTTTQRHFEKDALLVLNSDIHGIFSKHAASLSTREILCVEICAPVLELIYFKHNDKQ